MYEVEVMLGETDPSHIIRCIEYWDIEKRKYPHPRSPEALKILAQRWGIANGCYHAEAFCLIRSLQ